MESANMLNVDFPNELLKIKTGMPLTDLIKIPQQREKLKKVLDFDETCYHQKTQNPILHCHRCSFSSVAPRRVYFRKLIG